MSVWQTLSAFANARQHLAGQLGMMAVLHTWGQQLERHIHLHCLVPAGVLTAEQTWCGARKPQYLFPVRALSVKFRGKMRAYLAEQASMGLLDRLRATDIEQQLALTKAINWVVYSKPTLTYQETVVRYLARYCNRVGLSNNRLSWQGEHDVGLVYKNYRTDQASIMHCSSGELVRRFILHVLPKGFMRLRYYGFLANAVRRKALGVIRANLCVEDGVIREKKQPAGPACPHYHEAGMVLMSVSLPCRGMAQRNKERLSESYTS